MVGIDVLEANHHCYKNWRRERRWEVGRGWWGGGGEGEWERGGIGSGALSDQIGTTVIIKYLRSIAVRLHIREKTQLSGALLPVSLYEGAKVK